MMRKFFSKAHLWLSIPFGIVIAIICLTGSILVFQDEIKELKNPGVYFAGKHEGPKMPIARLVEEVTRQLPESSVVTSVRVFEDEDRNSKVYYRGQGGSCMVDPYTGEIRGKEPRLPFFTKVMRLHRFLLLPVKSKSFLSGKKIVGISTIVFVFIIVTGFVIWFPRNRKSIRNRFRIKFGAGWHRFWYDLHVSGGFYVGLFLLVMALTGLTWSFGWYRTSFYKFFGSESEAVQKERKEAARNKVRASSLIKGSTIDYSQWDVVLADLEKRYPRYNHITFTNAAASVSAVRFGNTSAKDNFVYDPANGQIVSESLYKDLPRKTRVKAMVYVLHAGKWAGLFSKILYFIVTLTGGVLVFTGYYFWIRRLVRKRRSR